MRTAVEVVRDYAAMTGAKFSYKNLVADLGLPRRTAFAAIKTLAHDCEIVRIGRAREGIYRWASPAQKEKALKERREAGKKWMKENSAYVEQRLKEV